MPSHGDRDLAWAGGVLGPPGATRGHPWVLISIHEDGDRAWAWVDLEPPRNTQGS